MARYATTEVRFRCERCDISCTLREMERKASHCACTPDGECKHGIQVIYDCPNCGKCLVIDYPKVRPTMIDAQTFSMYEPPQYLERPADAIIDLA